MKRFHVHVGVNDLDQSIGFYSTLFGAPPSVVKTDYAKWMLDDPRVNFAISSGHHAAKGPSESATFVQLVILVPNQRDAVKQFLPNRSFYFAEPSGAGVF